MSEEDILADRARWRRATGTWRKLQDREAGNMKTYIETKLRELGEEEAIKACSDKDSNTLVLTSAAYGGGGQRDSALLAELTTLGLVVKYAALCGKQVTILPQESS